MPTARLQDQRYLGDAQALIVHDLLHEDTTPRGCRVFDLVQSGQAVRFQPDRLRQALAEGYKRCEKCFFGLERRRVFVTRELVDKAGAEEVPQSGK